MKTLSTRSLLLWTVALISAGPAASQTLVQFETIPGSAPSDGLVISNQFAAGGVLFSLDGGGFPVLAERGLPRTAFDGVPDGMGVVADNPDPSADAGQFILTDDGLVDAAAATLRLDFSPLVAFAQGDIIDIDSTEEYTVTAYGAGGVVLDSVVLSAGGSGMAQTWSFAFAAPAIETVRIEQTGSGAKIGVAFDSFVFGLTTQSYCVGKANSQGCTPQIGSVGFASASDPAPFDVRAGGVLNNKTGLLFYGAATANLPFLGGTLCIQPPLRRTPIQFSGGNPPPNDCSGQFHFDMNAWIQSGSDPGLVAGANVFAQYWYRDPGTAQPVGLTNALQLTITP